MQNRMIAPIGIRTPARIAVVVELLPFDLPVMVMLGRVVPEDWFCVDV